MSGSLGPATLLALLGVGLAACPDTNWFSMDSKCYLPLPSPPFTEATEEDAMAMCKHIHPSASLPEIFDTDDLLVVRTCDGVMFCFRFKLFSFLYISWQRLGPLRRNSVRGLGPLGYEFLKSFEWGESAFVQVRNLSIFLQKQDAFCGKLVCG